MHALAGGQVDDVDITAPSRADKSFVIGGTGDEGDPSTMPQHSQLFLAARDIKNTHPPFVILSTRDEFLAVGRKRHHRDGTCLERAQLLACVNVPEDGT